MKLGNHPWHKKISYLLWKRAFTICIRNSKLNPLFQYPLLIFLKLSLDIVFKEGGMEAVKTAVDGFGENLVTKITSVKTEVMDTIGDLEICRRVGPDPIKLLLPNGMSASLEEAGATVASVVNNWRSVIGDGPVEIKINNVIVNAGTWLRGGDQIEIKKKGG